MAKNPGRNQNLVQNRRGDYTPEELHEWVVKAGRASADKRRRMKAQREILRDLMRTDCADEAVAEALISAGMEPSIANAINFAVLRKAQTGDIEAARYVRDTIGEKPTEMTALQISNQPIRAMDLTQLSDAELEALADRTDEED